MRSLAAFGRLAIMLASGEEPVSKNRGNGSVLVSHLSTDRKLTEEARYEDEGEAAYGRDE